jgi:hypothetical protein
MFVIYTAMGVRGGKQTTESVIIIHYWPIRVDQHLG